MKTIARKSSAEASEAAMDCDRPEVGLKGLTVIALARHPGGSQGRFAPPPPPAGWPGESARGAAGRPSRPGPPACEPQCGGGRSIFESSGTALDSSSMSSPKTGSRTMFARQ
eukprot:145895-Heterocapsa_arctica.AAC.1